MYDSWKYCKEYKEIKNKLVDIYNNEDDDYNLEEIAEHIQELYESGELQATQYDDLMNIIVDLGMGY